MDVAHRLLEAGADADGQNNEYESNLHRAVSGPDKEAFKVLLKAGADMAKYRKDITLYQDLKQRVRKFKAKQNRNAYDEFKLKSYEEMEMFLDNWLAKKNAKEIEDDKSVETKAAG